MGFSFMSKEKNIKIKSLEKYKKKRKIGSFQSKKAIFRKKRKGLVRGMSNEQGSLHCKKTLLITHETLAARRWLLRRALTALWRDSSQDCDREVNLPCRRKKS